MNFIRSIITVAMLTLLALCVAGWMWADTLPSPKMEGARWALGLCGLMSVGTTCLLWSTKQPQAN